MLPPSYRQRQLDTTNRVCHAGNVAAPPLKTEEIFASQMRRRRAQLGISTRTFAERMRQQGHEWHHTTVQRTESSKRPVRLDEAVSIAAILNVSLSQLLRPKADERQHAEALTKLTQAYNALFDRARYMQVQIEEAQSAITEASARKSEAEQIYVQVMAELKVIEQMREPFLKSADNGEHQENPDNEVED
jgi:transcriptional regulator with XRE-family HTH domain